MTSKKCVIDEQALSCIFSRARQLLEVYTQPIEGNHPKLIDDPHLARTLCYTQATLEYFRGKNLLPHTIEIKEENDSE